MRFHTFLLKYGEIGIKGKNRHLFEDRQMEFLMKRQGSAGLKNMIRRKITFILS